MKIPIFDNQYSGVFSGTIATSMIPGGLFTGNVVIPIIPKVKKEVRPGEPEDGGDLVGIPTEVPVAPDIPVPVPEGWSIYDIPGIERADYSVWGAIGESLWNGAANLLKGAFNTGKELVYTIVDIAMVSADAIGTAAGRPIGWEEWSIQGKSFPNATVSEIALNALRSGLAGGTLGVSEILVGVYNYSQNWDADAFQQHLGGVSASNLASAAALKIANGRVKSEAKSSAKTFVEQMTPEEAARYREYWKGKAPEQSKPYDMMRRYTEDGKIKQVTTYDQFGNRLTQFDLIDSRKPPHRHEFRPDSINPRPYYLRDKIHTLLE